jgi:hypothetical protein
VETSTAAVDITPFEHAILDVALGEVTAHLTAATQALLAKAHPIVERMTHTVTRESLLAVRDIKNEQQGLLARVSVVTEALEQLDGSFRRSETHE